MSDETNENNVISMRDFLIRRANNLINEINEIKNQITDLEKKGKKAFSDILSKRKLKPMVEVFEQVRKHINFFDSVNIPINTNNYSTRYNQPTPVMIKPVQLNISTVPEKK
jgi:hypothetical protein